MSFEATYALLITLVSIPALLGFRYVHAHHQMHYGHLTGKERIMAAGLFSPLTIFVVLILLTVGSFILSLT